MNQFQDKTLRCVECGKEFIFTKDEQEFFQQKGYKNEPKRCPECRKKKRTMKRFGERERRVYHIICFKCGKETTVSFRPVRNKPVYCSECFRSLRKQV
jgi:CxxC-x17-CxxC domain-containing protein